MTYSNKEKTNYTDTKTIVSTTNLNNNVSYIPSYYSLGYTIDFDQKDIDIIKKITDTYETDNDTLLGFISLDQDPNFSSYEIKTKENSASYLMLFNRTEKGVNYSINDNLTTTGEISSTIGFNKKIEPGFVFCGDLRIAAEQSLNYEKELNKTKLEGNISTGVLADMSIKTGVLKPGVGIGIKANYGISADSKLNDNLMVGMSHSGYVVSTPVSTDTGLNTSFGFKYRKDNDLAFTGNVFVAKENQKLSIGLFNEQTENNTGLGISLGAKYKRNEFNISYSTKKDKLNPTKNINYIGIGANIKL